MFRLGTVSLSSFLQALISVWRSHQHRHTPLPLSSLAQTLPHFPCLPPHRGSCGSGCSARPLDTPPGLTPSLGVDRRTLRLLEGTQLSSRPRLGTRPPHPRINAMAFGRDDRPQRAASGLVRPQTPPAPPPGVWEAARTVPLPPYHFSLSLIHPFSRGPLPLLSSSFHTDVLHKL